MNRRDFVSVVLASSVGGTQLVRGLAAQSAKESATWIGPVGMNDMQTFRLRWGWLERRAKSLWPGVKGNRKLAAVLASATFYLEVAENGMENLAHDEAGAAGWVDGPLRQAQTMLDAVEAGQDYFAGKTGVIVKAYVSTLDGSIQPYVIQVPEQASAGKLPLVTVLQDYGARRSMVDWGNPKSFEPWTEPYLRLTVHGCGSTCYKGVGGVDFWAVFAQVHSDYSIDPERMYLTGEGMGGAGTWYLGTHSPGSFAAIAPLGGFTDYRLNLGPDTAEWAHRVYQVHDALTGASNLLHTPIYFCDGDQDRDVEHSRRMAAKLEELGIAYRYDELKGVSHDIPEGQRRKAEQWLLTQRRGPAPAKVVLETSSLRFNRAYWIEVEGLREHFRRSRIEATAEGDRVVVKTQGITRFTLHRPGVTAVVADDQPLSLEGKTHFVLTNGKWAVTDGPPRGRVKRHSVQGPWIDAYIRPALYVVPASEPKYAELAEYDREIFRRAHGGLECAGFRGSADITFPIKTDREVTQDDLAKHQLLVFGDPESNTILARMHEQLPIRWSRDGLLAGERKFPGDSIGCKYVYPNPLFPSHYVTISMGTRPEALHAARIFHWQIPDYLIFDERAALAGKALTGEAYLAAGFFDENWELKAL